MNNNEIKEPQLLYPYQIVYHESKEINLMELLSDLWKHKSKIVFITLLAFVISVVYAYTAVEEWTSKAIVTQPSSEDLAEFYTAAQQLERFAPTVQTGTNTFFEKIKDADQLQLKKIQNKLYIETQAAFNSSRIRKSFVEKNSYFQKLTENMSELDKNKELKDWIEKDIKYVAGDETKKSYDVVTVSAQTAESAAEMLTEYVSTVSAYVLLKNINELKIIQKKFIADINSELTILNAKAFNNQKIIIDQTQSALIQAQNMGLELKIDPLPAELSSNTMYMLGSKALTANLLMLKKQQPILEARYYQLTDQLANLEKVSLSINKAQTFSYIDEPTIPFTKDQPKRVLILLIGTILGLLFGSMYVVLMVRLRK